MNTTKKAIAFALVFNLIISLTACVIKDPIAVNSNRSGEVITADSPWFYGEFIDVDMGIDISRTINYVFPRLVGVDDKYVYSYVDGEY